MDRVLNWIVVILGLLASISNFLLCGGHIERQEYGVAVMSFFTGVLWCVATGLYVAKEKGHKDAALRRYYELQIIDGKQRYADAMEEVDRLRSGRTDA